MPGMQLDPDDGLDHDINSTTAPATQVKEGDFRCHEERLSTCKHDPNHMLTIAPKFTVRARPKWTSTTVMSALSITLTLTLLSHLLGSFPPFRNLSPRPLPLDRGRFFSLLLLLRS